MRYNSTRGKVLGRSFEEVLLSPGYHADGGLALPETIPVIPMETLKSWAQLSFIDLFKEVFSLFVSEDEIPRTDLNDLIERALSKMALPEVVQLTSLKEGLHVTEMYHTRSLAFKDITVFLMAELMNYFMEKRGRHLTVLVGTTGDTGCSCIEAISGLSGLDLVVLYPKGRITNIQEKSMTTVNEENVHVFGADGGGDDIDVVIRDVCLDQEYVNRHSIGTANSINVARVLGQAVSYIYTYFKLCPNCDGIVEICVPTGGAGNITGGVLASKMGLPVRLVAAVNQNDIMHRALSGGNFSKSEKMVQTLSSAIDTQSPYNMERLMYLFSGNDSALVTQLYTEFETTGAATMPKNLLNKMSSTLSSFTCDDEVVKKTMHQCWKENDGYLVCPHTAVAVAYHYHKQKGETNGSKNITVVFATASPAKFPEAVQAAGLNPVSNPTVGRWLELPVQETLLSRDQDWTKVLKEKIEAITKKVEGRSKGHHI